LPDCNSTRSPRRTAGRPPVMRTLAFAGTVSRLTDIAVKMNHSTTAAMTAITPSTRRSGVTEMRRRGFASAKTNRFDSLGVALAQSVQTRALRNDGRRGDVAAAAIIDFDHALVVVGSYTQARGAEIHDIAGAQPRRALYAHAVVQDFRAVGGLHEQLILVHADIRFGARRSPGHHDCAARASDCDRKVRRRKAALTQGFANDQRAQMRSSQRITTGSVAAPGRTLISRRTSR